jgi:hypothetical protein
MSRTTITNMQVIRRMSSHWKHVVLEVSEYTSAAREVARPVLAKLCSTALSVESRICIRKKNNFLNKHPTAGDLCCGITTTIALSV